VNGIVSAVLTVEASSATGCTSCVARVTVYTSVQLCHGNTTMGSFGTVVELQNFCTAVNKLDRSCEK
jgi:hypothetical protein